MKGIALLLLATIFSLNGCNNSFSVKYKNGPAAPTLSLTFPTAVSSIFSQPTFTIQGLSSGDTVELFADDTCSTQVASGVSVGASHDLRSSALASGIHLFTAKRTNSNGTSDCSLVSVSYTFTSCPTGYIPIAANVDVGTTSDFCVMRFEARNDGFGLPVSVGAGAPWATITATQSKNFCTDPLLGADFDLISNAEWMTIARHLEAYANNWTSGIVGQEQMYQGHSDGGAVLDTTDENNHYNGTSNNENDPVGFGREQKRTLEFPWGDSIWDFSANYAEWVDWVLGGALDTAPTTCFPGAWQAREFPLMACPALDESEYMPANPENVNAADYDSDYGLGQFQFPQFGTSNTVARGGATNFSNSGVFHINYNYSTDAWGGTGFRCVYRP